MKTQSIVFYKSKSMKDVKNYCKLKNIKGKIKKCDKDYIITKLPKSKFKKLEITYNSKDGVKTVKGVMK